MYNDQVVSLSGYNILYILLIWLIVFLMKIMFIHPRKQIVIFDIRYLDNEKLKKFLSDKVLN